MRERRRLLAPVSFNHVALHNRTAEITSDVQSGIVPRSHQLPNKSWRYPPIQAKSAIKRQSPQSAIHISPP
jgi:hypothetical protein